MARRCSVAVITRRRAVTHVGIAAVSAALGRTISFVDVPPEAFARSLEGIQPPCQSAHLSLYPKSHV